MMYVDCFILHAEENGVVNRRLGNHGRIFSVNREKDFPDGLTVFHILVGLLNLRNRKDAVNMCRELPFFNIFENVGDGQERDIVKLDQRK